MPLGPTGYGDSPYQALSAFAGNPLLISLERLVEERCLAPWDLDAAPAFPEDRVDYGPVIEFKQRLLRLSYENFKTNAGDAQKAQLAGFVAANRWLAGRLRPLCGAEGTSWGGELEHLGAETSPRGSRPR